MKNLTPRARRVGASLLGVTALALVSCAMARAQTLPFPSSRWSRVLIVSGGPSADYNQYAIESNARYVASLTRSATWRRILFADGKPTSKTISTVADNIGTRARAIASWIFNYDAPNDVVEYKAPTLAPITGTAAPDSITRNLAAFGATKNSSAPELVYFTGHGSPGSGFGGREDYVNTIYSGWGNDLSERQLARSLQASTSTAPLVLIMVQCHSGGFANTLFQDGNPAKPIWNRDFCGFFASTPERMASGCTSQVNERDYQDFTTHFFAALSGVSRDGRRITGADYDGNGKVSLDEAYAYTQINDDSIDVPLSTTDAYLNFALPGEQNNWQKTSFSRLLKDATPAQKAVLTELSQKLGLIGENRLATVQKRLPTLTKATANAKPQAQAEEWQTPNGVDKGQFNASYDRLQTLLNSRFPGAENLKGATKTRVLNEAATLLTKRPADLNIVYRAYSLSTASEDSSEVEEARLLRFQDVARSIILTRRLQKIGTPTQKAIFTRLRTSESRSAF